MFVYEDAGFIIEGVSQIFLARSTLCLATELLNRMSSGLWGFLPLDGKHRFF